MQPMLQIRDRTAVIYYASDSGSSNTAARRENMLSVRQGRYSGKMSDGSKKRLTRAITLMAQASKRRMIHNPVTKRTHYHHLSFITLTVSDAENISHQEAYNNLLEPFLQWMRRTVTDTLARCYIWKGELQKRGQIHYHLITPAWIHYKEIRDKWNDLQRQAGYLDKYAKKHGHFKPNSTDIEAVKNKKSVGNYLAKRICSEMAKSIDARELEIRKQVRDEIDAGIFDVSCDPEYLEDWECRRRIAMDAKLNGKTWDCSNTLAGAKYFTVPFYYHHLQAFDRIDEANGLKILKESDYWHLIVFTGSSPPDLLDKDEKKQMIEYFATLLN